MEVEKIRGGGDILYMYMRYPVSLRAPSELACAFLVLAHCSLLSNLAPHSHLGMATPNPKSLGYHKTHIIWYAEGDFNAIDSKLHLVEAPVLITVDGPGQSFGRKTPCIIVDSGMRRAVIHSVVNSSAQTIYILTPITASYFHNFTRECIAHLSCNL